MANSQKSIGAPPNERFSMDVEVSGHIIDSLILPKVLDLITASGGRFQIKDISIGQGRSDRSHALINIAADSENVLEDIVAKISDHGAMPVAQHDCHLEPVETNGAFPERFYATTNQTTELRIDSKWRPVQDQEMDCGIVVEKSGAARCIPMSDVKVGMDVVIGHAGVRVVPLDRSEASHSFQFMNSAVSTEKPKGVAARKMASELFQNRASGGKTLVVGGPAIVHTGSGPYFCELIRRGYVDRLFAGNALATHDIEQAVFGTSLGVKLDRGEIVEAGHEHHLRAINRIRRIGSIRRAVETGYLNSGIMYECVRNGVPYLLAGSIRDDGPLPEVITDVLDAQRQMRAQIRDVTFCLMIATTLHSIAVGNLLPASVQVVCVDINPSTVIKLSDRGSFQTVGLVTDVEPFLRALVQELERLENDTTAA